MIISLGGSTIFPENGVFNTKSLMYLKKVAKKLNEKLIIVVGGGSVARFYINLIKDKRIKDYVGIRITEVNSIIVSQILNYQVLHPREISMKKTIRQLKRLKFAIISGWKPGFSTDYVAAYIAKHLKEKYLINLTRVGGIYTKNPEKYMDAKLIKTLTWNEFFEKFSSEWNPGLNAPFDPIAGMLCKRYKIKVFITTPEQFSKWINGDEFYGTKII